ncbi:O-antigen ligase family protein [Segetibacter koreensis]|uniref:O-antigen ligase family protein n=1 Tax=Segetibacter koreensis TaxID=398037 RepID=UPI00035F82D3|nr:O-antigen ligase family protein [Segetibacter koreensis]
MFTLKTYKEIFHFSVNFFSIFLLITFIPDILHFDPMIARLGYWGVKVLLAIWVILKTKRILFSFSRWETLIIIVYLIYGVNIFIDVFLDPLAVSKGNTGLMDFAGFSVIIILMLSFRYYPDLASEKSFWFFVATLTIGLILSYFFAIENLTLDTTNVRYDANSTVNSIGYGQMGCTLSLISLFGIISYKKLWLRLLFLVTFAIGMISIAKAGSRSPVVVLVVVMSFYFMARLGSLNAIIILCVVAGLVFIFLNPILDLLTSMGSNLAVRLTSMVENKESSGREEIWTNVIGIIAKSPVFGAYYIVPYGAGKGLYPHNFFLEIFMGTGIVGGLPFMVLVFASVTKSYKLIQNNHPSTWLIILYLQMIVFGMFSTSLSSSQDFWVLIFYVMSIKIYEKKKMSRPSTVLMTTE